MAGLTVPTITVGVMALLVVGYLLVKVLKFGAKLAVNGILGVIIYLGAGAFGAPIALTPVSVLVAVVTGIPGAIVMVLISLTGFPLVS